MTGASWQRSQKPLRLANGLRFMQRRVRNGTVVHITLPLPTKLRNHGFSDPGYNMYAIVRRAEPLEGGARLVGLEFIGNHPPAGYLDKPSATFRTQKWTGLDRRREGARSHRTVVIEYLRQTPTRHSRPAVTEN